MSATLSHAYQRTHGAQRRYLCSFNPACFSLAVCLYTRSRVRPYRYVVEPDGSLQCGEIPSSDGGLKASDIGFQSVSYPLGLAVSGSVMVLGGPMPASR